MSLVGDIAHEKHCLELALALGLDFKGKHDVCHWDELISLVKKYREELGKYLVPSTLIPAPEPLGGPKKPEPTCATCEHYYPVDKPYVGNGECRRYPKATLKADDYSCGEHSSLVEERNAALAQAIVEALPDYERALQKLDDGLDHIWKKIP